MFLYCHGGGVSRTVCPGGPPMAGRARFSMLGLVFVATIVTAAEQPIGASRLFLHRSSSGLEKLAFVSKDPAFLFPAIGGPDDPTPSGSGGLVVELFSPSTPAGVALDAPGGVGLPGWSVGTSTPA